MTKKVFFKGCYLFEEINMATMTLRGIDEAMAKMLKELAAKEGMSIVLSNKK
jgi:hypothetical protein